MLYKHTWNHTHAAQQFERERERERVFRGVGAVRRDGVTWPSRCCGRHCERPGRWVRRGGGGDRRAARGGDGGGGGCCCDGRRCWRWRRRRCWHCRPAASGCSSCSSSADSGTRSWLDVPSGWDCAPIPSASASTRKRWTKTLFPAPASGTWSRVSASCEQSPVPSIPADSVPMNLFTKEEKKTIWHLLRYTLRRWSRHREKKSKWDLNSWRRVAAATEFVTTRGTVTWKTMDGNGSRCLVGANGLSPSRPFRLFLSPSAPVKSHLAAFGPWRTFSPPLLTVSDCFNWPHIYSVPFRWNWRTRREAQQCNRARSSTRQVPIEISLARALYLESFHLVCSIVFNPTMHLT